MYTLGGCGTDLAPAPIVEPGGLSGLGCTDCGGTCGCGMNGLTMDGSGLFGTGIFGTGVTLTDFSTWGPGEILVAGGTLFVLYSVLFTTSRAASAVKRAPGEARKRRAAYLRAEAKRVSSQKGIFG
jgi:hypothetical protein